MKWTTTFPGRYESFLDPEEKLKAIHDVAEAAHRAGNYAFVYIAGTECITAHGDQVAHTLAKDHPDWLQRKITGEPAIFGGGTAFWIRAGRRGCVGESLRRGVAEDLHGAGAADCGDWN